MICTDFILLYEKWEQRSIYLLPKLLRQELSGSWKELTDKNPCHGGSVWKPLQLMIVSGCESASKLLGLLSEVDNLDLSTAHDPNNNYFHFYSFVIVDFLRLGVVVVSVLRMSRLLCFILSTIPIIVFISTLQVIHNGIHDIYIYVLLRLFVRER